MSWENGFPAHIFSRDYPRFLLSIIIENEKILMYSNGCICQISKGGKICTRWRIELQQYELWIPIIEYQPWSNFLCHL